MNKNFKKELRSLFNLLFLLILLNNSFAAEIELLYSHTSGTGQLSINEISALQFMNDSRLLATDKRLGMLTLFPIEGKPQQLNLSGAGSAFKSTDLSGISHSRDGQFIISNSGDVKIAIVDGDGKAQIIFGEKGSKAGMLDDPVAVAYSINQRIYVADEDAARVSVFNKLGIFLYSIGNTASDPAIRLKKPSQVAVDDMERIYVLETGSNPVLSIFDDAGVLLKRFTESQFRALLKGKVELTALAVGTQGRVFLADSVSGKVIQFNWEKGEIGLSFGSRGKGPGQYLEATALAVGNDNRLAVADSKNHKIDIYQIPEMEIPEYKRAWLPNIGRMESLSLPCTSGYLLHDLNVLCLNSRTDKIQIVSQEGKVLKSFSGQIKTPTQASFDQDTIVVLNKNKIMVFDYDGKLKTEFGGSGSREGQLDDPEDVYFQNNKIFVAESDSHRVQIFSAKGVFLDSLPASQNKNNSLLKKPVSIAVDANNNIYIADAEKRKIITFSSQKQLLYELGDSPGSPNAFKEIIDLALDSDNNLYVLASTEFNDQTIQVFSGNKRIFEFGSASKKSETAIISGSSISVSLSSKTFISIFDEGTRNKAGMLTFNYLQVPAKTGGVEIIGNIEHTQLRWQRLPGSYVTGFRVYGATAVDGEYRLVAETGENTVIIQNSSDDSYTFYRVKAVSGFGVEGPASNPRENLFQKGLAWYKEGKFTEAIDLFTEELKRVPDQPGVLKFLGLSYLAQKKFEMAAHQFQLLSEESGYRVEGLNLQINALFEDQQYPEAMLLVQQLIKASENNIESYLNCGKLSLKINDPIGAVDCLERIKQQDPNHAEARLWLGAAYIQIGALDKGLLEIEHAIKLIGQNTDLSLKAADLYTELGKPELAKLQYQNVLNTYPENTQARLGLAHALLSLSQMDEARNLALALAGQTESAAIGNYLLGQIALKNKQYGEAVLALSKATRVDASNADAWLALADTYTAMQQQERVRDALEQAVKANANAFLALKRLGLMYVALSEYALATDVLEKAAQLRHDDGEIVYGAAEAWFKLGKYASAAEYGRKALEFAREKIQPLLLMAQISRKSGKTGAAIEYVKTALTLKSDDARTHNLLGELYFENNLYDEAQAEFDKAIIIDKTYDQPQILLGQLFLKRRLFDKAIKAFEKAVQLNGSSENHVLLDTAYEEKKKSLEFAQNAPAILLEDLHLKPVFSAAYKQYNNKDVGSVNVRNAGATQYKNLVVSFNIKGYMDFPTTYNIDLLEGESTKKIPLIAAFNNKVLDIDEDTGVQVEIKLNYTVDGHKDDISITQPITLYGKNAIVWETLNMVGSFVTPKDDALRDFVRRVVNEFKPEKSPINENLLTAMTIFDAYSSYGLKYQIDPNNSFSALKEHQIDYVQFARETLKLKSGDCDDLSVLLSASLENLGIATALVDVPGHLFMLLNTGVEVSQRTIVSGQDELLVILDNTVWIPVETTMIATNFMEAWAEGANKYNKYHSAGTLKVIMLKDAWQEYQPVTLAKVDYNLELPDKSNTNALIENERKLLLEKSLARLVIPYETIIMSNSKDTLARMQIAIIYARYGLYERATTELNKLLEIDNRNSAVYNNQGNIYFAKGDFQRSYEAYTHAERLDANDGGIRLNMALALYKEGKISQAKEKFNEAILLDQNIGKKYSGFSKLLSN